MNANVHVSQTNDDHHKVIVRSTTIPTGSATMWDNVEIAIASFIPPFLHFYFV